MCKERGAGAFAVAQSELKKREEADAAAAISSQKAETERKGKLQAQAYAREKEAKLQKFRDENESLRHELQNKENEHNAEKRTLRPRTRSERIAAQKATVTKAVGGQAKCEEN